MAAVGLGLLIPMEINAIKDANSDLLRDDESNFFKEIRILKEKNDDLRIEVGELEETLKNLSDQNAALLEIDREMEKYKELSGDYPVFGPGIQLTIQKSIGTNWLVDTVNELFNSGAQAVSINGTRIKEGRSGFDTLPKGDTVLSGNILSVPLKITAIGDKDTLSEILQLPGGLIGRLKAAFPGIKLGLSKNDVLSVN